MNQPLITVSQLQAQIGKGVLVIDCRFNLADKSLGYEQYRRGHIPGAYYFDLERDLSSAVTTHGGRHPLPEPELLAKKLRQAGAHQQTLIVAYDDSRQAYAARVWWLLRYLGHDQVAVLDGGYQAWCDAGGAQDRREPGEKLGTFKAKQPITQTISYNELMHAKQPLTLIDSRESRRYAGLEEPIDPLAGHIPSAINYPWQEVTDEKGFIKPVKLQQKRWETLPSNNNVVVYCGSGVTACVNLLSLHLSGIDATLYPGSWSDWCSHQEIPQ